MAKEFYCRGKLLADYLVGKGAKLIRTESDEGNIVFIFEKSDSVDAIIDEWESNKKKWMF